MTDVPPTDPHAEPERNASPSSGAPPLPEPPPPGVPAPPTADEKLMALLAHILAIPTGFVGPLVIWLVKRQESAYVDHHGKEALNFQITVFIAFAAVSVVACIPLVGLIAIPAMFAVGIGSLVFTILATVKANEGVRYVYPYAIRLIK